MLLYNVSMHQLLGLFFGVKEKLSWGQVLFVISEEEKKENQASGDRLIYLSHMLSKYEFYNVISVKRIFF